MLEVALLLYLLCMNLKTEMQVSVSLFKMGSMAQSREQLGVVSGLPRAGPAAWC